MEASQEFTAAGVLSKRPKRLHRLLMSTYMLATALAGVVGLACFGSESGPQNIDEMSLVALYHAAGGENWDYRDNWLSNAPVGRWHGVTTDGDGRVVGLSLPGNNLSGEIPLELGDLANLEELNLCGNDLEGEIPLELGDLASLDGLNLAYNQLSGEIPPELGRLVNLEYLSLARNRLSGDIPPELGRLVSLRGVEYFSDECQLLPRSGWRVFLLRWGSLARERWIFAATNYRERYPRNWVTWPIWKHWTFMATSYRERYRRNWVTWPIWKWLDLSTNRLSGEIPAELGNLASLERLRLDHNQLSGEIPAELGNLTRLKSLTVNHNRLSGRDTHLVRQSH